MSADCCNTVICLSCMAMSVHVHQWKSNHEITRDYPLAEGDHQTFSKLRQFITLWFIFSLKRILLLDSTIRGPVLYHIARNFRGLKIWWMAYHKEFQFICLNVQVRLVTDLNNYRIARNFLGVKFLQSLINLENLSRHCGYGSHSYQSSKILTWPDHNKIVCNECISI